MKFADTVSPSVFATLRLITNSNLFDSTTGKSAGFSPLRIRPVDACLPITLRQVRSITHQPAGRREGALFVACRDCIFCRKRDDQFAPTGEERIGGDEHSICLQLLHRCKRRVDFWFAAGIDDLYPLPEFVRSFMQFLLLIVGGWKTWVHQCGDQSCIRYQLSQKAQLLRSLRQRKKYKPL